MQLNTVSSRSYSATRRALSQTNESIIKEDNPARIGLWYEVTLLYLACVCLIDKGGSNHWLLKGNVTVPYMWKQLE